MAEHDDSDIARVLRAAGGRTKPSEDTTRSVYASVHAEWRASVAKRRQPRTQRMWLAAAASAAVATVAVFVGRTVLNPQAETFASISRSIGVVQVREGESGRWHRIPGNTRTLRVGESLHTGSDGRIALSLSDGASLRLDHDTNIVLADADRIDVSAGAVYIDSGVPGQGAGRLRVGTPAGIVRHIGTQYEARIVDNATRIRVREGRVNVEPAVGAARTLQVGEQVLVSGSGIVETGTIEPSSDEWEWASNAAPEFDIDGRPLHEFLAWVARELGLKVVFATPESEAEARRAVLSGSVSGLTPAEALAAVLPTTSLRSAERDGRLVVELAQAQ